MRIFFFSGIHNYCIIYVIYGIPFILNMIRISVFLWLYFGLLLHGLFFMMNHLKSRFHYLDLFLLSIVCIRLSIRITWLLYPVLNGSVWHHRVSMTALEVRGIASALAATASICFEGAIPWVIILHKGDHVLCLIVSPQTVSAIFLTKQIEEDRNYVQRATR